MSAPNGSAMDLVVVPELEPTSSAPSLSTSASASLLRVRLRLPLHCSLVKTEFYSDDGKSSLVEGDGKEGRQKLGMIVNVAATDGDAEAESQEELWLCEYDRLPFSTNNKEVELRPSSGNDDDDDDDDEDGVCSVRTRRLGAADKNNPSSLLLSGSRGVGGVQRATTLGRYQFELFDMEEDEELDDGEEEEEDDDEDMENNYE